MRLSVIYLLVFALCAASSCKKKDYKEDVVVNDPVFYFNGRINNNPVSFSAGKEDYYMFSSSGQGSNVFNFTGTLRKTNCSDCANAFFIQLNDRMVSGNGGSPDINAALKPERYPFYVQGAVPYRVKFKSTYNKSVASYLWDFGDGQTSAEANPEHIYSKTGTYQVNLRIVSQAPNSCMSYISNRIHVGPGRCNAYVNAVTATPNTGIFSMVTTGISPLTYLWNFGDGSAPSAQLNPSHTFKTKGSYPIKLRVIDAMNDTAWANYNFVTDNDISSCQSNFQIEEIAPVDPNAELALGSAFVKWREPGGKWYSSDRGVQTNDDYFEIISIEDFERNENGEKTKKIKVKVKCTLYNGFEFIKIDDAEAVIAVAYH